MILVQSARPANLVLATKEWLDRVGVPCDGLFMGRPWAHLYVDDKAVQADEYFKKEAR